MIFFFFFKSHNPASSLMPWRGGPLCRNPWLAIKVHLTFTHYLHFPSLCPVSHMGFSQGMAFRPVVFTPLYHHLWYHSSMRSISCSFPSSPVTVSFHRHFWSICFQVLHLLPHFSPCMHPNAAWVLVSVSPTPQRQNRDHCEIMNEHR